MDAVVIVHGGAWAIPDHLAESSRLGVKLAAEKAYAVLAAGGSALDAVEAALVSMEDDPSFDAGRGSCLNADGLIEMDASVMDGATLKAGAVAGVKDIANPIRLARQVMERTDHVLLVGDGANRFAEEMGVATVDAASLVTAAAAAEWDTYKKYQTAVDTLFNNHIQVAPLGHDTVGAVALDSRGSLAAATSTGGITGKRVGRVGDSPLIGSGTYCDNLVGGVSCTGHGESIIKVCLAKHMADLMERGVDVEAAADESLERMRRRVGGAGGLIAIEAATGRPALRFTTERMAWAICRRDSITWGLDPDEINNQPVTGTEA